MSIQEKTQLIQIEQIKDGLIRDLLSLDEAVQEHIAVNEDEKAKYYSSTTEDAFKFHNESVVKTVTGIFENIKVDNLSQFEFAMLLYNFKLETRSTDEKIASVLTRNYKTYSRSSVTKLCHIGEMLSDVQELRGVVFDVEKLYLLSQVKRWELKEKIKVENGRVFFEDVDISDCTRTELKNKVRGEIPPSPIDRGSFAQEYQPQQSASTAEQRENQDSSVIESDESVDLYDYGSAENTQALEEQPAPEEVREELNDILRSLQGLIPRVEAVDPDTTFEIQEISKRLAAILDVDITLGVESEEVA